MAFTKKNDEAVSPVIGVILMVAITVILAAVIAAFVFGMAGNITKTKIVAVTAARSSATVGSVTNMGGQDIGTLTGISVTNGLGQTVAVTSAVGNSQPLVLTAAKAHIIATGTFSDGTQQVLLDTYI